MAVSSRTPEGRDEHCPICRARVRIEPSLPNGDAPCPSCGHLLWFEPGEKNKSGESSGRRPLPLSIRSLIFSTVLVGIATFAEGLLDALVISLTVLLLFGKHLMQNAHSRVSPTELAR